MLGWVGGKDRKLYLNNNKKKKIIMNTQVTYRLHEKNNLRKITTYLINNLFKSNFSSGPGMMILSLFCKLYIF